MNLESKTLRSPSSLLRTILSIFVHLLTSTIGVIVTANLLTLLLFKLAYSFHIPVTIKQLHWVLTEIHGFPVQAVVGLFAGFILAKYMRRRVMIWIWLLPLMFLCLRVLFT